MANEALNDLVTIQDMRIDATLLPKNIFSEPYLLYVIQQGADMRRVATKANDAGAGAYNAQVKNEEQDLTLSNHSIRITAAESSISTLNSDVSNLKLRVTTAEELLENHEERISALEDLTTRQKSELIFSGISLPIPTTPTNFISLIKTLTPSSGSFAPFFSTALDKMVVFNKNKTAFFKLSIIGSWTGGTSNRSMQLTFSGAVPDTLVASRNSATVTDNVLLSTFFSVDKDGFLTTNGSTITIQSNGSVFTATTIKLIAEQ